jgi:hypothetical protein
MAETWLRPNRRALSLGLLLPLLMLGVGVPLTIFSQSTYARVPGALLAASGLLGAVGIGWQMLRPRLSYERGCLAVYARSAGPYRVPIDFVEGFLLGQGPSMLPGKQHERTETTTIVVRLADAAVDWAERDVHPSLGKWCGGYITLRGTWCEPLSVDLVGRMNVRLAEVHGRISSESRP